MLAALPAVVMGIYQYGMPALGVVAFSVSCAMIWELLMNFLTRRPVSIGDGNAAVIGLLFAMLLPATTPWWAVLVGTFVAVVIGKQIFGGMGCNPFNPALVSIAIIVLSWRSLLDFNEALVNYDLGFYMVYPLGAVKHFGTSFMAEYSIPGLLMGRHSATFTGSPLPMATRLPGIRCGVWPILRRQPASVSKSVPYSGRYRPDR